MEIIHIILGKANPNRLNGVNKVVYQLATKQAEHKLNVSVWGITKDVTINFDERKFKTVLFKKEKNPFRVNEQLLHKILEKKEGTLFHIHGGWIPVFSTIAVFMHKHNIPYVLTPHGAYNTIAMKRNAFVKSLYFRLFEKNVVKYASTIHCIGRSEITGLNSIFKTNKTTLLPYGFEFGELQKVAPKLNHKLVFGYVGRIDIYTKGLDLLLNAFSKFYPSNPESQLWIIGDGADKSKLQKLISKLQLTESVILYGSKFGNEKNELIQQLDFFCHPSRNEGLPSAVLEALNLGIPCIVSEATNVSSQILNCNCGLSVANEKELERAFHLAKEITMGANRSTFKTNAQFLVRDYFNWDKLIPKFNEMYLKS